MCASVAALTYRPQVVTAPLTGAVEVTRTLNYQSTRYRVSVGWSRFSDRHALMTDVAIEPQPDTHDVAPILMRAAVDCFEDYCVCWKRDHAHGAVMEQCGWRLEQYANGYLAAMEEDGDEGY